MSVCKDVKTSLNDQLKQLRLPAIRDNYESLARRAEKETLGYEQYLLELTTLESEHRQTHRIERLLRDSKFPLDKSLQTFQMQRLPSKLARQVGSLRHRRPSRPRVSTVARW